MAGRKKKAAKRRGRTKGPSAARIAELIEAATMDAYGESEQMMGFFTMLEDNLAVPFETRVLGVEVTIECLDLSEEQIVAVCSRGRLRQRISILELPLPDRPPEGAEWIEALRHWARGRQPSERELSWGPAPGRIASTDAPGRHQLCWCVAGLR